jgi:hypothetical protein
MKAGATQIVPAFLFIIPNLIWNPLISFSLFLNMLETCLEQAEASVGWE